MILIIPPEPPPHRDMFDSDDEYDLALARHGERDERRREILDDQAALDILAVSTILLAVVVAVIFVLYTFGGVKLIAQAACIIGLASLAMVHAYRFIRTRLN